MVVNRELGEPKFKTELYEHIRRPSWRAQTAIIVITLAAIIITVILGYRTYDANRTMALDQFNRQQLILARSAARGLETYFSEASIVLSSATEIPAIRHMTDDCLYYMQHMYGGFIPKTSVRRYDETGVLRFIYPSEGWRADIVGTNYGQDDFFRKAAAGKYMSVSDVVRNEKDEQRIRMAIPVYADGGMNNANQFTGVLAISFDLNVLADTFISHIASGETGYAWLTDQEGTFLAHHDKSFIGRNSLKVRAEKNAGVSYSSINRIQEKIIAGEEGIGRYLSGRHRGVTGLVEKLIAYAPAYVIDRVWAVAVVAPVKEVDLIIRNSALHAMYSFGFVLLILACAGVFLSISAHRWSALLERKVEERTKELKETSDYLNNLIRCANAPIVVINPEKNVTLFNDAFVRMSGRTERELLGKPLSMLFPPKYRAGYMKRIEKAMENRKSREGAEIPIVGKDGNIRVGRWNSSNIYSEDGTTLIATIAHGEDITLRKKAEANLRRTMKNLTMAQQMAHLGSWEWDIRTNKVVWSDETYRLFGWAPQEREIDFATYLDRIHPDDKDRVAGAIQDALEAMEPYESEHRVLRADGEIRIHHTKGEIRRRVHGKPLIMAGIVHDITEQKRAEREKRQLENQLFHVQKMRDLGTLVAGVAHEINNPINKIIYDIPLLQKIWIDVLPLLERHRDVEPGRKYGGLTYQFIDENMPQLLADMHMAADRLSRIVSNLKDFSKHSNIHDRKPMIIHEAVENALRLVKTTLDRRGIDLVFLKDERDASAVIEGNLQSIEQVIVNIVVNAIEAIDHDEGRITVTSGRHPDDHRVTVTIADNGRGIDPSIADKIFDPFVTDRNVKEGTGLGLSISNNIVEAHGGSITFHANEQEGTTFVLNFPAF